MKFQQDKGKMVHLGLLSTVLGDFSERKSLG